VKKGWWKALYWVSFALALAAWGLILWILAEVFSFWLW